MGFSAPSATSAALFHFVAWPASFNANWLVGDPCLPPAPADAAFNGNWARLDCSDAGRVIGVNLASANLNGALPAALSDLALATLDVRDNSLEYPATIADWAAYNAATLRCRTGTNCRGLPPESCSAFGPRYQLSLADPNACDETDLGDYDCLRLAVAAARTRGQPRLDLE